MSSIFQGHADDAVSIAPDFHSIIFEDETTRVIKVTVPPGASAPMHWHPRTLNYVLSPGKLRFTDQKGVVTEAELMAGKVTSGPERSHAVENISDNTVENILIEFKI